MKESKYMNNEKEKQRIKGKHNNVKSKQNAKESKNNKKEKQKVKNVIPNNIKLNQKMKENKNADKHEKQKMKNRTMNNRKEKQNILDGIIDQISSFDNKANILITAIGIAFSISLIFVERPYNSQLFKKINYYSLYLIIFIIYIISSITAITFFILVVVPRRKKGDNYYANYYNDIAKLEIDDIEKYNNIFNKYIEDDKLLTEQIIINSKICKKKHNNLKNGILMLIIMVLSFLILSFMSI